MTETTKTVFEKFQIRKTKKQKTAFINYVSWLARQNGYKVDVEKGSLGARNIVVGDLENAKVVYTAHYDTCARLPFPNFITPKNFSLYLLYQLVLVVPLLAIMFLFEGLMLWLSTLSDLVLLFFPPVFMAFCFALVWLLLAGPANKHTANDNTSGVTTLIDIMTSVPLINKDKTAFVFFDLEEQGLIGSSSFKSKHKAVMREKLLINFDCVSDGENFIFAFRKQAKEYVKLVEKAFVPDENVKAEFLTKGVFYPSDQACFPCGVGVASLKKTKKHGILYMDRIHTNKDTVYREENIEYLRKGALRLIDEI